MCHVNERKIEEIFKIVGIIISSAFSYLNIDVIDPITFLFCGVAGICYLIDILYS